MFKIFIRRILFLFFFFGSWICMDTYWNMVLLRTPLFGRFSKYAEWTHYPLFAILGMISAKTDSHFLTFSFLTWCVLDELTQYFLPNRIVDATDITRNVFGFWAGYFLIYIGQEIFRSLSLRRGGELG